MLNINLAEEMKAKLGVSTITDSPTTELGNTVANAQMGIIQCYGKKLEFDKLLKSLSNAFDRAVFELNPEYKEIITALSIGKKVDDISLAKLKQYYCCRDNGVKASNESLANAILDGDVEKICMETLNQHIILGLITTGKIHCMHNTKGKQK